MRIWPLTEYERGQLNYEGKAFYQTAHTAVDQMLDRNPTSGDCDGKGVLIDELLGILDGPFRSEL